MDELERWLAPVRAAEATLARTRMSPSASRRVARRIAADERRRRSWWVPYIPALSFAAGAALVLLVLAVQGGRVSVEQAPRASQSQLDRSEPRRDAVIVPPSPAELPVCAPSPSASCAPAPAPVPGPSSPAAAAPPVSKGPRVHTPTAAAPAIAAPNVDDRIDVLLRELRTLRRAGRFVDAARRLEQALLESWPARTREVLHYELGTILDGHIDGGERACSHWREHLDRFPHTRYARAIADARQRRGCT